MSLIWSLVFLCPFRGIISKSLLRASLSFQIATEADFDEEVMEVLEMMEGEVASQQVIYQAEIE